MAHPPVVHSALAKLARSEIAGVNVHTLPIALHRTENDHLDFASLNERQVALALLQRISYPETAAELGLFLDVGHTLNPATLVVSEINDKQAPAYMTWLADFLNYPQVNIHKNTRELLPLLASNHQ